MAGQEVKVEVRITNAGQAEGAYAATLKLDGKDVGARLVRAQPGESATIIFTFIAGAAGTHTLELGERSAEYKALKPAQFSVTSLTIQPARLMPGQKATIEAEVANSGEVEGTYRAALLVNGQEATAQEIALKGGARGKLSFVFQRDTAGDYNLDVGGAKGAVAVLNFAKYTSSTYGYSLYYPADWEKDELYVERVFMRKPRVSVVTATTAFLPAETTLDEFLTQVIAQTKELSPRWQEVARTPVKKDTVVTGYYLDYEVVQGGIKLKGRAFLTKTGRLSLLLDTQWKEADDATYRPLMETVLNSFTTPPMVLGSYRNPAQGFSVKLPQDWEAQETGRQAPLVQIRSPLRSPPIMVDVSVGQAVEGQTAKDRASALVAQFVKPRGFVLDSEKEVTLAGKPGYEMVLSYPVYVRSFGEETLFSGWKTKLVFLPRGKQEVIIKVETLSGTFDSFQDSINEVFSGLALEEPVDTGKLNPVPSSILSEMKLTTDKVKQWYARLRPLQPSYSFEWDRQLIREITLGPGVF